MKTRDILDALRKQDFHTANESFARVMQEKLADALATERHAVCETILVTEAHMPAAEVQRVFDEVGGDVEETQILCGIQGLQVNDQGQVISFVQESYKAPQDRNMWSYQDMVHYVLSNQRGRMSMFSIRQTVKSQFKGTGEGVQRAVSNFVDDGVVIRRWDAAGEAYYALVGNAPAMADMAPLDESVNRPNTQGQGYDDDYVNNPYHGIIRKYGYEYSHSTPTPSGVRHTYKQDNHYVGVFGNTWSTSSTDGVARPMSGSHPNTNRSGADLERHLRDKAGKYGLTEAADYPRCKSCGALIPTADANAGQKWCAQCLEAGKGKDARLNEASSTFGGNLNYQLVHAVTDYDRKQSTKPGYNHYALPQYLQAIDGVKDDIQAGRSVRKALVNHFTGRLLNVVLKAAGEPTGTPNEIKFGWTVAEAFGQAYTEINGITDSTNEVVAQVNGILDAAQNKYIEREVAKKTYGWMAAVSDEEATRTLSNLKHRLSVYPKAKYINIDRLDTNGSSKSAVFMVDKTDGKIYGVKGYGVVHKGYYYGTTDSPKIKEMAIRASVLEKSIVMREF